MPYRSPYPDLSLRKVDLLTHLFPDNKTPSDRPIWIDADDDNNSLSPREMLQWIKRIGSGLDKHGIGVGEVVMIFTPNHIFVPAAYLGIVGSRRIFSGANPVYTLDELTHQVKNTGTRVLLVHPSLADLALKAAKKAGLQKGSVWLFSGSKQKVKPIGEARDWQELLGTEQEAQRWQWHRMTEQEAETTVATVNFSSGTTGMPKGVAVSHFNLVANLEQNIHMRFVGRGYGESNHPPERWLSFLPLYHAYGQLYTNMATMKLDIPCWIMKAFNFEQFLSLIQKHKITNLQVAPPIIVMLAKRPETAKYDISSVTDILSGAAPLPLEMAKDVSHRYNVQINSGWGMTEVTCGGILVPGGVKEETGGIGELIPNTEARLIDEDGNDVAHGQRGELCIRGPQVCLGYWKNEKATKELLVDGWLRSGDVAIFRNGQFWIVDRMKELIKVNALQVAPAELEAKLLEHESVNDAAVVGIKLQGEEWPRAYVQLAAEAKGKITEQDIQAWFKDKVAKHKQLTGGVMFVDEVPKLASGKIMRKVVRQWAERDAKEMEGSFKARL